ncbi:MAG: 3-deoxy-8-phosphooctulonate synthase [Phycisphaerales bacterium]
MAWTSIIKRPDNDIAVGGAQPLLVIAGPCVLESVDMALRIGETVRDACADLGVPFVFKASFDKANRSSVDSPRGPGLRAGLDKLASVGETLGVPITTDIHSPEQAAVAAGVVDILQIPAFLCRQTDLIVAAGEAAAAHGRLVNIKKGQFLAPREMVGPLRKLEESGCTNAMLTERGTFFGYHRLVNDFIGFADMMELPLEGGGHPAVCFDCTHSAQLPGESATTGGRRDRVPMLARAAVAAGAHAVFLECHPDPPNAASDASTQLRLEDAGPLLRTLVKIREACR